jgi:two-component system sensor histidine kinase/response regulator
MANCRNTKETIRYHSEAVDKNGETIWTQSTLTPILDDQKNITKFVGVDSDITALKKAQEMINRQKQEIETQRDELERLNITKDKFFSIIAHDLRNPFHSILGFSDLLIKDYENIEDQKKKEFIRMIFESSQNAHNLLENLLQWSRTQSDTIRFNPSELSLSHIINENVHLFRLYLDNKNITLTSFIDENTTIYADKNMIHTVVRNLLNNAVKFTPIGGKISVTSQDKGKFISVGISDTGIGINPEDIPKLFHLEDFHTTQGTEGEAGTGLGLIICHDFIRRQGGEITVDSEPGKGTTFAFTLPKSKANSQQVE